MLAFSVSFTNFPEPQCPLSPVVLADIVIDNIISKGNQRNRHSTSEEKNQLIRDQLLGIDYPRQLHKPRPPYATAEPSTYRSMVHISGLTQNIKKYSKTKHSHDVYSMRQQQYCQTSVQNSEKSKTTYADEQCRLQNRIQRMPRLLHEPLYVP